VEFLEDHPSAEGSDDREKAIAGYNECRRLSSELPLAATEMENPALSFLLAEPVADLTFRQTILGAHSESERLKQLAEYLPKHVARELHVQKIKAVAPRNGHGKTGPAIH
jgi:hypothetical protein